MLNSKWELFCVNKLFPLQIFFMVNLICRVNLFPTKKNIKELELSPYICISIMKIDDVLAKFKNRIVYLQVINFTNGEMQDMI